MDGRRILSFLHSYLSTTVLHKAFYLLWSISKERNAIVFKQKLFNPVQAIIRAKRASIEWRSRNHLSHLVHTSLSCTNRALLITLSGGENREKGLLSLISMGHSSTKTQLAAMLFSIGKVNYLTQEHATLEQKLY